jgi:5-formaminoimidazole-4-carboxamide-1-(beta)-D-ribofuranosyl 5'-monophosphate synthetase
MLEQIQKAKKTVTRKEMISIINGYDLSKIQIGMIASHSALDLSDGATDEGFQTLAVCQKGREKTYSRYKRIISKSLVLDSFSDVLRADVQKKLRDWNVLFVPNRSLTAYVNVERVEKEIFVPFFGNRSMLKTDERKYQYELFQDAGILHPKKIESYKLIDKLCMVKAVEPVKKIERAFFTCASPEEFLKKWKSIFGNSITLLEEQMNTDEIWIEEFALGAQFNFNYFYSPISEELEFLGIDRRIQTNLDGILKLPAQEQLNRVFDVRYIEIGHESATIRESMLEEVYAIGEKFVAASKRKYPPGIIGPFALQGAVTAPDQRIVIYDLSPRMPGSPVLYSSPYSKYFFGHNVTSGHRVAMEVRRALEENKLEKIVT